MREGPYDWSAFDRRSGLSPGEKARLEYLMEETTPDYEERLEDRFEAFEAALEEWLATPEGRFAQYLAEAQRG